MESTGIYWLAPYEALEDAGIPTRLVNAHQVKQLKGRKTDIADSLWLARVCQFGLANASFVPPRTFRELRQVSRHRRKLIGQRTSVTNRVHKLLDRHGVQIGGILADLFGRRLLDGLIRGDDRSTMLASLTGHVARKLELLGDALTMSLTPRHRVLLADLVGEHDSLGNRVAQLDQELQTGLTPWREQLDLLQTIPGIDSADARELMVEIGPDLGAPNALRLGQACVLTLPGELFPTYTVIATSNRRASRATVVARHRAKQGWENGFKGRLREMDLHHPPTASFLGNQLYYTCGLHCPAAARGDPVRHVARRCTRLRSAAVDP